MAAPAVLQGKGKPWGLEWRSSVWFVTLVVGLGVTTDLLVYSIVIPVFPFRLESLGYSNVSSLVGWILFSFSSGLVASTPPIAMLSERHFSRRLPLILGLVALIGSQVMLMEAPKYWVMCLARVIQGISSSVVWTVGLALVCDTTPEEHIGRQLGFAMSGVSLGLLVGAPAGGALYQGFGFRGPFIFGIIVTVVDLVGRLLVIERQEALRWGHDPAAAAVQHASAESGDSEETQQQSVAGAEKSPATVQVEGKPDADEKAAAADAPRASTQREMRSNSAPDDSGAGAVSEVMHTDTTLRPVELPPSEGATAADLQNSRRTSLLGVIARLGRSPRALTALFGTVVYGLAYSSQEPALPLHMQKVWGFDSAKVGLVYIAAVVPVMLLSPVAGLLADRKGSEWVTFWCLLLAIPWWGIVVIPTSLPLFIVALSLESAFTAAVVSPLSAELALVSQSIEGIGYAHIYGAFNLAFGVGSALGPVIGGQLYDHVKHGWSAVCLVSLGMVCLAWGLSFCYTGPDPLLQRMLRRRRRLAADAGA